MSTLNQPSTPAKLHSTKNKDTICVNARWLYCQLINLLIYLAKWINLLIYLAK